MSDNGWVRRAGRYLLRRFAGYPPSPSDWMREWGRATMDQAAREIEETRKALGTDDGLTDHLAKMAAKMPPEQWVFTRPAGVVNTLTAVDGEVWTFIGMLNGYPMYAGTGGAPVLGIDHLEETHGPLTPETEQ